MSKDEIVSMQLQAISDSQTAALKSCLEATVDLAVASMPPSEGGMGFTQEQMDQAIAAAVTAKSEEDAVVLSQAHAQAEADLATASQALAEMTAKELSAEGVVSDFKVKLDGMQSSFEAVKSSLDAIKAFIVG